VLLRGLLREHGRQLLGSFRCGQPHGPAILQYLRSSYIYVYKYVYIYILCITYMHTYVCIHTYIFIRCSPIYTHIYIFRKSGGYTEMVGPRYLVRMRDGKVQDARALYEPYHHASLIPDSTYRYIMYTYIHTYIYMYIYIYVCIHTYTYYIHTYIHTLHTCICMYICMCMCICMHVYVCVYTFIYLYICI
jgi:hypothetical protein